LPEYDFKNPRDSINVIFSLNSVPKLSCDLDIITENDFGLEFSC
jgi:hypothetical protein